MKMLFRTSLIALLLTLCCCVGTQAMENDMIKVGLKYGDDALYSANLENHTGYGSGYAFGYFDASRTFVSFGTTEKTKISVTADGNSSVSSNAYTAASSGGTMLGGYHLQLKTVFSDYEAAKTVAEQYAGAFVAYLTEGFAVRVGQFTTQQDAENARASWNEETPVSVASPSKTGVTLTETGTNQILFEFDCGGLHSLAVCPLSTDGTRTVTWFKNTLYFGAFEYQRVTGGNISVINVLNIEDYVKCVIIWEMNNKWPMEALKAQAVCARTYASCQTRHRSQGFDVCPTTDCQAYYGMEECTERSDQAVDETKGVYIYYDGKVISSAVYYSCNGGASEDAKNVWGGDVPYLQGKEDPYEANVPSMKDNYYWAVTYTADELSTRLKSRNYDVGTVKALYVSEFTPTGNVLEVTIVGTKKTVAIRRESCRTVLGARSMRFTIGGGDSGTYFINSPTTSVAGIRSVHTISGSGKVEDYSADPTDTYVLTASGLAPLKEKDNAQPTDTFVISGSGSGHNVGMSQWGAYFMAEEGKSYLDILKFYYTGVDVH